ncbi:MAG: hypothetical protein ABL927_06000 [Bdellovibrionales bacterium]
MTFNMKLNAAERKLLIKILENTVERFEPDDLIHMIKGPKYRMVLDELYTECFRPHIKYGVSLIENEKEMSEVGSAILHN